MVKNPWRLTPLRSFPEVQLAPVEFVLRTRPGSVALFDATGGAWRIDAIAKIKAYLETHAGEGKLRIIA